MERPKNWQDVLDFLTYKATQDGLLKNVDKTRTQEDIIRICYEHKFYREVLLDWILCTKSHEEYAKSVTKAASYRELGNKQFRLKDNLGSVSLYTESIQYAVDGSEDLSLALANRSAALFHIQNYEDCLRDIELAFEKGYPSSLHYKLYMRQGHCLLKLGRARDAVTAYEAAQKSLKKGGDASASKLNSMQLDAEEALRQALSQIEIQNSSSSAFEEPICLLPVPAYGENKNFMYASEAIVVRNSDSKGRHVKATRDIKMGDILFVEKPFSFVVLPDQHTVCHHCCKSFKILVPCWQCTKGKYCSKTCSTEAWQQSHQWECCGGTNLLSSVGIAHLGLRVVLQRLHRWNSTVEPPLPEENCYGNKEDNYPAVYHLMPHLGNMQADDLLQYGLTATLLTLYLREHTNYFKQNCHSNEPSAVSEDVTGCCTDEAIADKQFLFLGGLILRHIAQLVCNAHAITKLDTSSPSQENRNVVTESQVRVATAIYPSASMMNHSCDPNIINSFCNQYLIVRASKDILKGQEVYNCYGPHFRRMSRQERQDILKGQYFFMCTCEPCSNPVQYDFQERFSALLCLSCKGPLVEQECEDIEVKTHQMVCCDCGKKQSYSHLVESAFKAHGLFNKACMSLEAGNVMDALKEFESCQELRQECLYKSNQDIYTCLDQIAKCYATLEKNTTMLMNV